MNTQTAVAAAAAYPASYYNELEVTSEEIEALDKKAFTYYEGFSKSMHFDTVEQMANEFGVDVVSIESAVKYNHGKYGAFHFTVK